MKLVWGGSLRKNGLKISEDFPSTAKDLHESSPQWMTYFFSMPVFLLAWWCIFIKKRMLEEPFISIKGLAIGVVISILLLVVHEFIHALCCPKNATILFFFSPHGICLIPKCPLSKARYILMALLPSVVLGLCPLFLWLFINNANPVIGSIIFGTAIGSLSMCVGDFHNAVLAARKMTAQSILITIGGRCFYYTNDKCPNA